MQWAVHDQIKTVVINKCGIARKCSGTCDSRPIDHASIVSCYGHADFISLSKFIIVIAVALLLHGRRWAIRTPTLQPFSLAYLLCNLQCKSAVAKIHVYRHTQAVSSDSATYKLVFDWRTQIWTMRIHLCVLFQQFQRWLIRGVIYLPALGVDQW